MLIQRVAHYNDLSDQLRKEVEDKVRSFGKSVRYRFDISNPNPDPTKHNGDIIWPTVYTLDPTVFSINDPYEKREGVSKSKRIALVEGIDEKGLPNRFKKVRIHGRRKGILTLELESDEGFAMAVYLELHPKLKGGMFADNGKRQMIDRIDEVAAATKERAERSARKLAMDTAEKMDDSEVMEFADAMGWDSGENMLTLRNRTEEMAENNPVMFNDLVSNKRLKYQAAIKRAVDKKIWTLNPMDCKLSWSNTNETIAMMGKSDTTISPYERLAEWFMSAGNKADAAYSKLLSLEGKKEVADKEVDLVE